MLLSLVLATLAVCALVCAGLGGRWARRAGLVAALQPAVAVGVVLVWSGPPGLALLMLAGLHVASLVALASWAWRERRSWAVAAVGAQGLALALDALRFLTPQLAAASYLTALAVACAALTAAVGWSLWETRALGLLS